VGLMPEQKSSRALVVTTSPFEQPFQTEIWPFGLGGLNLKDQHDAIKVGQFARHTNLIHTHDRGLSPRPGLTEFASAGTNHHSVRRLNDPEDSTYTRIWGIDQSLYRGQSGALSSIDTGYSGDPLVLLPHRPPLSGDPWMFVADRQRMRKVRADGLDLQIGLPAPGSAPIVSLGTRNLKTIADFVVGSDTDPAVWTPNAGYTYDDPPVATDPPEILEVSSPDSDSAAGIHFGRIASTPRPTGDYVYFGVPITRDLSTFGGGLDITDNDYMHLWVNFSHPQHVVEFRVYVVCSSSFSPSVLPGIPDSAGNNIDAYVKVISANDFAQFFQAQADLVSAGELARVHAARDAGLQDQSVARGYATQRYIRDPNQPQRRVIPNPAYTPVPPRYRRATSAEAAALGINPNRTVIPNTPLEVQYAQNDPSRSTTVAGPAGSDQWKEIGIVGIPLRRGDFMRMGTTPNRDWSTITGLVVLIKSGPNSGPGPIAVRMGNFYVTGGAKPDTGEPGSQPYDFRYTDYDPRTGAESNPSPEMDAEDYIDTLRRSILVDPGPAGDSALRQRVYVRGGSLTTDWFFAGVNASDGGVFTYDMSDEEANAAGTLDLDHYQPVATIDENGDTVLAEPVHTLFGPVNGMLFGLGDKYRPGHLYWCTPDQPDHWGVNNNYEVCSPSEELMAGLMYGPQPFCFSRERLYAVYPNLGSALSVSVATTACRRGIVSRTAWAIGVGGIYGVSKDALFVTSGGAEQVVSEEIQRLFRGESWNGYSPIDFDFPKVVRLSVVNDILYFQYQDTDGNRRVLVLPLLLEQKCWAAYTFGRDLSYILPDDDGPDAIILCGGRTTGESYLHTGFSDDGIAITWLVRTGDWDLGRPREDKLLGDQILDADLQGVTVTLQNRLNNETVENAIQAIDVGTGRKRYTFDSFGTVPQRARTISTEITGSSTSARPVLYFLGQSHILEPDVTVNRVTQWDDLGHPDESYVTGITLDVDTGGEDRTIIFERDFLGLTSELDTKTVNTNGRHKVKFTWDALPAHKVRIRPNDDCKAWILYKADWIALPEPPRIAGWDIHFEADGDQYYTGLDLYCDTGGAEKQIEVTVDGVVLTNPYTLEAFWRLTANGRRWLHMTFLAGRGHVFHFRALDANVGLLYTHKWHTEPEPSEQSNWNQNFSAWGTQADKWLKAIVFEADTFGANKQVRVEVDGTLADTLTVNCNGRLVQQLTLSTQKLGRIWRIYPADGNPGRLYTAVPLFDVEPYKLNRWETQETNHGVPSFQSVLEANITIKSTAVVTLRLFWHVNQGGSQPATVFFEDYFIPSTNDQKNTRFVPFGVNKGILYKYLFTSPADFFLYQEESHVLVQPWGNPQTVKVQPFGNDDVDITRNMIVPQLAAARSGGGS